MINILNLITTSPKKLFIGLAGPGTGKSTSFMTIAQAEEFRGKKILILSFINKLVDDLKQNFKSLSTVEVSTLHSFAMKEYKRQTGKKVYLDENLDELISEDRFFIDGESTNYKEKFHENRLLYEEEEFYRKRADFYKWESIGNNLHSFNSIIYEINQLFDKDESKIPSDYDLILIDEFQDFNLLEYKFIDLLNKKNITILVGDDDQSLYAWKGARPQVIRDLYRQAHTEEFSMDYCYRCPEVIVKAVNDLILVAKNKGYLKNRLDDKKFLYPKERKDDKHEISAKYPKIDFLPSVSGDQLFYQLSERIREDTQGNREKRVLVLTPSYFKQNMYGGLVRMGLNVVEYELFGNEKHNKKKHKYLIDCFNTLSIRKTDNLALRKILYLYQTEEQIKETVVASCNDSKKLWNCITAEIREKIGKDITIFKTVKIGKKKLTEGELSRFNNIFNIKNLLSKMLKGFDSHTRGAIEVEIVTVTGSKGLSADFVYYVGIDDGIIFDQTLRKLTDRSIREFLVGMTRAKEKLTLISLKDKQPSIIDFIIKHVNKIELK